MQCMLKLSRVNVDQLTAAQSRWYFTN